MLAQPKELEREADHEPLSTTARRPRTPPIMRLASRLDEVASSVGISRRTLERLRAAGKFPRPDLKVGKLPLWSRETLATWMKEGGSR